MSPAAYFDRGSGGTQDPRSKPGTGDRLSPAENSFTRSRRVSVVDNRRRCHFAQMCTRSDNCVRLIRNIFPQIASDLRVCFGDIFPWKCAEFRLCLSRGASRVGRELTSGTYRCAHSDMAWITSICNAALFVQARCYSACRALASSAQPCPGLVPRGV